MSATSYGQYSYSHSRTKALLQVVIGCSSSWNTLWYSSAECFQSYRYIEIPAHFSTNFSPLCNILLFVFKLQVCGMMLAVVIHMALSVRGMGVLWMPHFLQQQLHLQEDVPKTGCYLKIRFGSVHLYTVVPDLEECTCSYTMGPFISQTPFDSDFSKITFKI